MEQGNGTTAAYTYDNAGRVATISNRLANGNLLSSFAYSYDQNGNRTQQVETQHGFLTAQVLTTDYVYDTLDRLESYTETAGNSVTTHAFSYYPSYDRATQRVERDGTLLKNRTYQYDDTYWLTGITETAGAGGSIAYQYDPNGNTTHKTDTTGGGSQRTLFSYNSRNQLKQVATGTPGAEVGQGSHDYNYAGMRIRHLGSERGDIEYVYDGRSILDELHNNSTNLVAHYRYGDRLLSLNSNGTDQFYHYASLGTTANLTNAQGEAQVAYRTDPFGGITQQQGESVNRHVFTGQEHDEKTGLIYFGARFYDPDTARFINQDTYLGESTMPPSLHRYLYAYANPTVYVDPDGHQVYKWVDENGVTHFSDGGRSNAGKVHGKVGSDPTVVAEIEKRRKAREQEEAYNDYCEGVGCADPDPDRTAQVSRNMQRDMARPVVTQEGSPSRAPSSCFVEEMGRVYCQKNLMFQAFGETSDAGGMMVGVATGLFFRNPGATARLADDAARLGGNLADSASNSRAVVKADPGAPGKWNKHLNKPMPDMTYDVGGHFYRTDSQGRVVNVKATLSLGKGNRSPGQQRVSGRDDRGASDHGGHLIGDQFGGAGEAINLVPMHKGINGSGGLWYKMETRWQEALKNKKSVEVEIIPNYVGDSKRPVSFTIYENIGGELDRKIIRNTSTGM